LLTVRTLPRVVVPVITGRTVLMGAVGNLRGALGRLAGPFPLAFVAYTENV
jgi:hypothetical protein